MHRIRPPVRPPLPVDPGTDIGVGNNGVDYFAAAGVYEELSRLSDEELKRRAFSRTTLARDVCAQDGPAKRANRTWVSPQMRCWRAANPSGRTMPARRLSSMTATAPVASQPPAAAEASAADASSLS